MKKILKNEKLIKWCDKNSLMISIVIMLFIAVPIYIAEFMLFYNFEEYGIYFICIGGFNYLLFLLYHLFEYENKIGYYG